MRFCGEILYNKGLDNEDLVHSDICHNCNPKSDPNKEMSSNYREFLHAALDEWLDNANGTGAFWLGDPQYFLDWEKDND